MRPLVCLQPGGALTYPGSGPHEVGGKQGRGMTHHGNPSLCAASQAQPRPGALVCGCLHVCVSEPNLTLTPHPQSGLLNSHSLLPIWSLTCGGHFWTSQENSTSPSLGEMEPDRETLDLVWTGLGQR